MRWTTWKVDYVIKMKHVTFRRLIQRVTVDGFVRHAIILWDKRPTMFSQVELPNGMMDVVETQHQWFIRIDLWLFLLEFNWETKI